MGTQPADSYDYVCVDRSILTPRLKTWFFAPLFRYVPQACPANIITLLASIAMVAAVLFSLGAPFSPVIRGVALPLLLFTYLAGDHLDGMQAIATRTRSPLGEFVDHGLDAYHPGLLFVILQLSLKLSPDLLIPLFAVGAWSHALVFHEHWKTGTLYFEPFGATEAIIFSMAILILSCVPGFLELLKLPFVYGLTGIQVLLGLGAFGALNTLVLSLRRSGLPSPRFLICSVVWGLACLEITWSPTSTLNKLLWIGVFAGNWITRILLSRLTQADEPLPDLFSVALLAGSVASGTRSSGELWIDLAWFSLFSQTLLLFKKGFSHFSHFWIWRNPPLQEPLP